MGFVEFAAVCHLQRTGQRLWPFRTGNEPQFFRAHPVQFRK